MTRAPSTNPQVLKPPEVDLLQPRSWSSLLVWGLILGALALSWKGVEMDPLTLWRDSGNMSKFAQGFFPPNFHDWRYYL